ncbi:hypothetical protein M9435_003758 [Picochlorum sp. BPE23]|nr:hypothetical protein M9435_003758 [Picochlorum sp. BPE23]
MALGTAKVFSSIALAIDIISCFFSLVVTGFFAYVISNYFGDSPWFIDLGVAFAIVCFLILLATSILGCMTSCGKPSSIGLHGTKFGLDLFAWLLTLISVAINTNKTEQKVYFGGQYEGSTDLGTFLDSCDSVYGFNEACAWSVGIVLLWCVFCLLFVNMILHALAILHVRNHSNVAKATAGEGGVQNVNQPVTTTEPVIVNNQV